MNNSSQENVMNTKNCNMGKFFVIPTFAARFLHLCKDTREPISESWNYKSRIQSSNYTEMMALTTFRDIFLDLQT
jgi:hypothetical protein